MPELSYNDPLPMGVFGEWTKYEDAKINKIITTINEYREQLGEMNAGMKAGGETAGYSHDSKGFEGYFQPGLSLSGDVSIYHDLISGRPKKATVKSWKSNVGFLDDADFMGLISDLGVGAVFWGATMGIWDAKVQYGGFGVKVIDNIYKIDHGEYLFDFEKSVNNQIKKTKEIEDNYKGLKSEAGETAGSCDEATDNEGYNDGNYSFTHVGGDTETKEGKHFGPEEGYV